MIHCPLQERFHKYLGVMLSVGLDYFIEAAFATISAIVAKTGSSVFCVDVLL
jgi:hypothetical protein